MAVPIKAYLGSTPLFDTYTRPSDWLALPTAEANSVKILHAVFDQAENYVAIRMQTNDDSTYTINWGDGNTTTASSNTVVTYNYNFTNLALNGTLTTRGYKQAIITITPQVGKTFTLCDLSQKVSTPTGLQAYATGFLDINLNLPNLTIGTRLLLGTIAVRHAYLERVWIDSWGSITSTNNLFSNCTNLQSINETEWNTTNISTMQGMFFDVSGLTMLDVTNWNTSNVSNFLDFIRSCTSIVEIKGATNLVRAAATNITNMFFGCSALQKIDVSGWNTTNCTNFSYLFGGCRNLQTIDVKNWNVAKVTTINNMFDLCYGLQEIDISLWNLALCTNVNNAFFNCFSIRKLGPCSFATATTIGTAFQNCRSLTSCGVTGMKVSLNISNCSLSSTALNQIYTNLATVVGQTITVTGNYGTTTDNPAIATAKGWTVTG